jgi:hypothetical protein
LIEEGGTIFSYTKFAYILKEFISNFIGETIVEFLTIGFELTHLFDQTRFNVIIEEEFGKNLELANQELIGEIHSGLKKETNKRGGREQGTGTAHTKVCQHQSQCPDLQFVAKASEFATDIHDSSSVRAQRI